MNNYIYILFYKDTGKVLNQIFKTRDEIDTYFGNKGWFTFFVLEVYHR